MAATHPSQPTMVSSSGQSEPQLWVRFGAPERPTTASSSRGWRRKTAAGRRIGYNAEVCRPRGLPSLRSGAGDAAALAPSVRRLSGGLVVGLSALGQDGLAPGG
jgi:hypothetical protein